LGVARLQEHQGKELLRKAGIAILPGHIAENAADAVAAAEALGYPVALKAQIPAGKRGLAGGIRFASNRDEVEIEARVLFGATIHSHRVARLLIEKKATIERELYVAIMSDSASRAPVMIASTQGGMGIEEQATDKTTLAVGAVDILRGAPPYVCLDLLRELDLPGALAAALAQVMARLYRVYRSYDCTLAEINPLAVTPQGLVALDARLALDDDALFRHPELGIERSLEVGDREPTPLELAAAKIDEHDHRGSAHFVQIDPDGALARHEKKIPIGFDGVGTGVSMAVMDELVPLGFLPMNFCDTSGNPTASKLYRITKIILAQPLIEGYVFASCLSSQQLDNTARGIVKAFKEIFGPAGPRIPCVLSFRGAWDETALAMFEEHGITKSPLVRLLGRDSTERDVAVAMSELHGKWRQGLGRDR
jgi:succinyl-CoA synthetase beta subunit